MRENVHYKNDCFRKKKKVQRVKSNVFSNRLQHLRRVRTLYFSFFQILNVLTDMYENKCPKIPVFGSSLFFQKSGFVLLFWPIFTETFCD